MASVTPMWIKISDFGISKRTIGTNLRTACGTMCYKAPEQQGLLPGHLRAGTQYTNAADLWALGVVIHEVLTSKIPFLDTYEESDTGITLESCMEDMTPQLDTQMLYDYCNGSEAFPVDCLQQSGVGNEGIDFVKILMAVNPADRATAEYALNCLRSIEDFCKSTDAVGEPRSPTAVSSPPRSPVVKPHNPVSASSHPQSLFEQRTEIAASPRLSVVQPSNSAEIASSSPIGPALLICQLLGLSIPPLTEQANRFAPEDQVVCSQLLSMAEKEHSTGVPSPFPGGITHYVDFLMKYIECRPSQKGSVLRLDLPPWPSFAPAINMLLDYGADIEKRAQDRDCHNSGNNASRMAAIFAGQGMYDEQSQCLERFLVQSDKALGKDDPDMLRTVYEMAKIFRKQGRYDKALEWYVLVHAGRARALGNDHSSTLDCALGIARVFKEHGMYDKTLQWYELVHAGRARVLGDDHPSTLDCAVGIARVFREQEMYDKALEWFRLVLAGRERDLGNDHRDTLDCVIGMARIFRDQGKYDNALQFYGRVLVGRERALGNDHTATLDCIVGMARVCKEQGKYDSALQHYDRVLGEREKALGNDHPETLDCVVGMAKVYSAKKMYDKALECYARVLVGQEKALGKEHASTRRTRTAHSKLIKKTKR